MNSIIWRGAIVVSLTMLASCVNNSKIFVLLRAQYKDDVISGAIEAGRTKDTIFIQDLLRNAYDFRMSTNINFYGVTVYQAKMQALEKIFGQNPPKEITYKPDSSVIRFYSELARRDQHSK